MSWRDVVELAGCVCLAAAAAVVDVAAGLAVAGILMIGYATFGGSDHADVE